MSKQAEQRILDYFHTPEAAAQWGALFHKISCTVAYAHGEADYNGHYGIRELCDICPSEQIARCAGAWVRPDLTQVTADARALGATGPVEIDERAIIVEGLDEPPRYFLQHGYGFPCHDRSKPHRHSLHGRAPIGWPHPAENGTAP